MNEIIATVTLPCGCKLSNKFVDPEPLAPEQHMTFILFAGRLLGHWLETRASQHVCPAPQ